MPTTKINYGLTSLDDQLLELTFGTNFRGLSVVILRRRNDELKMHDGIVVSLPHCHGWRQDLI